MRILVFLLSAISTAALAGGNCPQATYGPDGRKEAYESSAAGLQPALQATAALFTDADFSKGELKTSATLKSRYKVCASEAFALQPTAAHCSAVLVGPDRILTAGHCICLSKPCDDSEISLDSLRVGFNYRMQKGDCGPVLGKDDGTYYRAAEVISYSRGFDDYALIRLDRAVEGHTPLDVDWDNALKPGDLVYMPGHPMGLPLKLSDGHVAFTALDDIFTATLDSFAGNSGSPVINGNNFKLAGILARGQDDYNPALDVSLKAGECRKSIRYDDWNPKQPDPTIGAETVIRATEVEGLAPVATLTLSSITESSVRADWKFSAGELPQMQVAIRRGWGEVDCGSKSVLLRKPDTSTEGIFSNLNRDTHYTLGLCSANAQGAWTLLMNKQFQTSSAPVLPPQPTGLRLIKSERNALVVTWQNAGENSAAFDLVVRRGYGGVDCSQAKGSRKLGQDLSFRFDSLAANTRMTVGVCSRSADGLRSTALTIKASTRP